MSRNQKIILAASLLALLVILTRFLSINTPIMRVSFAFLPTMIAATYLGWKWTLIINVLGDLIGAILFPTGPYFIGYTFSAAVSAIIYGLILYRPSLHSGAKQPKTWTFTIRTFIAVALVTLLVHAGMNSLWLSLTTGKAYVVILEMRIIHQLIMVPIQIVTFLAVWRALQIPALAYLYNEEIIDD